jgi:hypothetical protein
MKYRITLLRNDGTEVNHDESAIPEVARKILECAIAEADAIRDKDYFYDKENDANYCKTCYEKLEGLAELASDSQQDK